MKASTKGLSIFAGLLVLSALNATPSYAQSVLKVMRQGLGDGTVDIIMGSVTVTCPAMGCGPSVLPSGNAGRPRARRSP